jgi:hypothetical protein
MNCEAFERWLDDGRPEAGEPAMHAHAATCARCGAALAAMLELEHALEISATPAPAHFTDRVMSRIGEQRARAAERAVEPALAWWVRAAADPAGALALVAAALLLWRGEALWRGGLALAASMAQVLAAAGRATPALPAPFHAPYVWLAFALALVPLALWGAFQLYTWVERACAPRIEAAARRA